MDIYKKKEIVEEAYSNYFKGKVPSKYKNEADNYKFFINVIRNFVIAILIGVGLFEMYCLAVEKK